MTPQSTMRVVALATLTLCVTKSVVACSPWCHLASPLILDLDHDGLETGATVHFDYASDGFAEKSNWVESDDGVLVWDRNGDGKITTGSELFGNHTILLDGSTAKHGFEALADLDSNLDGIIDEQDPNWGNLRILRWVGADFSKIEDSRMRKARENISAHFEELQEKGNTSISTWSGSHLLPSFSYKGVPNAELEQYGEFAGKQRLTTLVEEGIASLYLTFRANEFMDEHGNEHRQMGSYIRADGTRGILADVWFVTIPFWAYHSPRIPTHSDLIRTLPDLPGPGRLHTLRDAMALDDAGLLKPPHYIDERSEPRSLSQLVSAFKEEKDHTARKNLAERILLRWTGVEGVTASDYENMLTNVTAQRFAVVEVNFGRKILEWWPNHDNTYHAEQLVNIHYNQVLEWLLGSLMLETHLADLVGAAEDVIKFDEAISDTADKRGMLAYLELYHTDFSKVVLMSKMEKDARLGLLLRALASQGIHRKNIAETAPEWLYEFDWHEKWKQHGVYAGETARRHDYEGRAMDQPGAINVFRTSGSRRDVLRGRNGEDIYQLTLGTGHDLVIENWKPTGPTIGHDRVMIAPGITPMNVKLSRKSHDLFVSLFDANGRVTDSLRIAGHYSPDKTKSIEAVEFEDGTRWGFQELKAAKTLPYLIGPGRGGHSGPSIDYDRLLLQRK